MNYIHWCRLQCPAWNRWLNALTSNQGSLLLDTDFVKTFFFILLILIWNNTSNSCSKFVHFSAGYRPGPSRNLQAQVFRLGLQVGRIQAIKITRNYCIDLNLNLCVCVQSYTNYRPPLHNTVYHKFADPLAGQQCHKIWGVSQKIIVTSFMTHAMKGDIMLSSTRSFKSIGGRWR